jgi:hypothetical protein
MPRVCVCVPNLLHEGCDEADDVGSSVHLCVANWLQDECDLQR